MTRNIPDALRPTVYVYALCVLQEHSAGLGMRRWRFQVVENYLIFAKIIDLYKTALEHPQVEVIIKLCLAIRICKQQ